MPCFWYLSHNKIVLTAHEVIWPLALQNNYSHTYCPVPTLLCCYHMHYFIPDMNVTCFINSLCVQVVTYAHIRRIICHKHMLVLACLLTEDKVTVFVVYQTDRKCFWDSGRWTYWDLKEAGEFCVYVYMQIRNWKMDCLRICTNDLSYSIVEIHYYIGYNIR